MFSKIAFSVKNGPFRHIFHIDSAKYRAFFQTKWNVGFKEALFRQKTRKFPLFDKSKMLQFSRIKKMCCFKRATFCIIQRKVKRRYNLLVQIFIFLLRCLLNLVKVHIMLCTFKNGTIKSLILTLNMFKWFFRSFLFDMVSRTVTQKFWVVTFPFSEKTNCRGPTHTNSFDQFSFYAFSIFRWS